MKRLLFVGLLAVSFAACNRNMGSATVPEPVITSFNQRYPQAQDVQWKESGGMFEADFLDKGEEKEATYTSDGKLLRVENM